MDNQYVNLGTVKIADDVVTMIATLAAVDVEGVTPTVDNPYEEVMSRAGIRKMSKGVKVDLIENTVTIDILLGINYGYSIPDTCRRVQDKVSQAVENMTGLKVADVNIRVTSVNLPKNK